MWNRPSKKGGQLFFALDDGGDWEIMKFAAKGMYTGTGAGSARLKACIDYTKKRGLPKILNVSNRKCTHAVHLYRKFGFREIPVDRKMFPFERADIAFEMML